MDPINWPPQSEPVSLVKPTKSAPAIFKRPSLDPNSGLTRTPLWRVVRSVVLLLAIAVLPFAGMFVFTPTAAGSMFGLAHTTQATVVSWARVVGGDHNGSDHIHVTWQVGSRTARGDGYIQPATWGRHVGDTVAVETWGTNSDIVIGRRSILPALLVFSPLWVTFTFLALLIIWSNMKWRPAERRALRRSTGIAVVVFMATPAPKKAGSMKVIFVVADGSSRSAAVGVTQRTDGLAPARDEKFTMWPSRSRGRGPFLLRRVEDQVWFVGDGDRLR